MELLKEPPSSTPPKILNEGMWCWHKWDIYKERRKTCDRMWDIVKTTKVCRKCEQVRVKEKFA